MDGIYFKVKTAQVKCTCKRDGGRVLCDCWKSADVCSLVTYSGLSWQLEEGGRNVPKHSRKGCCSLCSSTLNFKVVLIQSLFLSLVYSSLTCTSYKMQLETEDGKRG